MYEEFWIVGEWYSGLLQRWGEGMARPFVLFIWVEGDIKPSVYNCETADEVNAFLDLFDGD